jgi:hypothetical protein
MMRVAVRWLAAFLVAGGAALLVVHGRCCATRDVEWHERMGRIEAEVILDSDTSRLVEAMGVDADRGVVLVRVGGGSARAEWITSVTTNVQPEDLGGEDAGEVMKSFLWEVHRLSPLTDTVVLLPDDDVSVATIVSVLDVAAGAGFVRKGIAVNSP